jgi:hypothetical protein
MLVSVRNTETNGNKPKKKFCFVKQIEKQPKQIEFRFFSVPNENNLFIFEFTLFKPLTYYPEKGNCIIHLQTGRGYKTESYLQIVHHVLL